MRNAGKLVAILAVVVSSLTVARPVLADGDSLSIDPATTTASVGDNFTVNVVGSSAQPLGGTQASLVFDPTELQVTSLAKSNDWVDNGAGYAGYPTPAHMATFIATANDNGEIPAIAAFFSDGASIMPAGDYDLYSVTFTVIACGDTSLDLPLGPTDGTMIDGNSATYGNELDDLTSASGDVSVPCADDDQSETGVTSGRDSMLTTSGSDQPIPSMDCGITLLVPVADVNLDGAVGLGDLGNITGRWGQTSPCYGWIRADANNDGAVGLGDVGKVTAKWGQQGFMPPTGPAGAIIFVHGVQENWANSDFSDLLTYAQKLPSHPTVTRFQYYEDSNCSNNPTALQPETISSNMMPVASPRQSGNCDSQSDIALNVALLDQAVKKAYRDSGDKKVILVGYSMGAAIIRGFLEYSKQTSDTLINGQPAGDRVDQVVDSALFIQGDQSGSDWLRDADGTCQNGPPVIDQIACWLTSKAQLYPYRPAYSELIPQSLWYAWQNSQLSVDSLPNIPYFNVYSSIVVQLGVCLGICVAPAFGIGDVNLGDLAMHNGSDSTRSLTSSGGEMFLDGTPGPQNWEWELAQHEYISFSPDGAITDPQSYDHVINSPINHWDLPSDIATSNVQVNSCRARHLQVSLESELEDIIAGRVSGQPYNCTP